MKIVLGNDHAGFGMKAKLKDWLIEKGYEIDDVGAYSEESVDYPDFAHHVAREIEEGRGEIGILICGSGNGVAITANKHKGIRAALAWLPEIAALARQHNNANVLCLPARFVNEEEGRKIIEAYLNASFEGGRHERRVEKIGC